MVNNIQHLSQIYESENSQVYRAIRMSDHQPIIIKKLKENYPAPEKLSCYKKEYNITHCLEIDGVIKAYSLEESEHSLLIIYEDFGGESLRYLLDQNQSKNPYFTLKQFLEIAIKITEILGEIHQHNIIHKDLNPSNIVFNPQTKELKIIDFGISTQFYRENISFNFPNLLEGTLAYISPEQTGRINRSIDYRTDFYALGCTFYELLTGQVPFLCDDLIELIYSHLTKLPLSFQEINQKLINIPSIIEKIVFKLMAKTPEERYQSAWGITQDLKYCLQQLEETGTIQNFLLGEEDYSLQLIIPEKLYGRDREIKFLSSNFDSFFNEQKKLNNQKKYLFYILGESGLGKTVLIKEIYPQITVEKVYLIEIQFREEQQNLALEALVNGLRQFFKQLTKENKNFLNKIQEKLIKTFSDNLNLLINIIPEIKLLINQNIMENIKINLTELSLYQYHQLIKKIILMIIEFDLPLVLFCDNLQWADPPSLKIIKLLVELAPHNLFLIMASRNSNFLDLLPENIKLNLQIITLINLDLNQVKLMLIDTFKCSSLKAYELGQIFIKKTGGNPFFLKEFILLLNQKDLIIFDQSTHIWQWDLIKIEAEEISINIADLIISKIKELPEIEQNILKIAVCFGYNFNIKSLAKLLNLTLVKIDEILRSLVKKSMILPLFSPVKISNQSTSLPYLETEDYQFSHQRFYQATYDYLSLEEKQKNHLNIAKNMLANLHSFEFEKNLLKIVEHYNKGMIINPENEKEIINLIQLNLLAAKQAKLEKVFALHWIEFSLTLINNLTDPWQNHHQLMITIYQELITEKFINGDFIVVENLCKIALNQLNNLSEKINFYEFLIKIKNINNCYQESLKVGLDLLLKLKIDLNQIKQNDQVDLELFDFDNPPNYEKNLNQESQIALKILVNLLQPALIIKPQLIIPLLKAIIERSNYPKNAYFINIAYSYYSLFLCQKVKTIETAYYLGKITLRLLKTFNIKDNSSQITQNFYGIIQPWHISIQKTIIPLKENLKKALEFGDLESIGNTVTLSCQNLFLAGRNLGEINQECEDYLDLTQQLNLSYSAQEVKLWQQLIFKFKQQNYSQQDFIKNNEYSQGNYLFIYYFTQTIYYYYFKDYTQAKQQANLAKKYVKGIKHLYIYSQFIFYHALILISQYFQSNNLEQKSILQQVNYAQKLLQKSAENCSVNFAHLAHLIEAEKMKVLGNYWQSLQFYDLAIQGAIASQNLPQIALTYELTGEFCLTHQLEKLAQIYLKEAHYYYQNWQGINKVKALEKQYFNLLTINQLLTEHNFSKLSTISSNSNLSEFDLQSIVKAYQAISQEIHLDNLLNQIMKIVLENAGADQGILLFYQEQKLILVEIINSQKSIIKAQEFKDLEDISPLVLPHSILYYVNRTHENLILNNLNYEHQFLQDPYLIKHQPKAILCLPLIYQQQLIGILYLENNLTNDIFTPQRIELLNLLCAQAIISLQNAQLYYTLEQKVEERTAELSQLIQELETTQKQLIEAEKMASLGGLVAGVAHEINTPVGIGVMMASHLAQETGKFKQNCESGALKRSVLNDYLETAIESSQLILNNLEKAAQLVQSFKQVAVDQSHLEKRIFGVKEYLEEILISLQPTLKSTNYFVTIEGDEKIKIESYPGAFSQIITNLIINSIQHAYPTGKIGRLKLKIKLKNKNLEIRYSDDGCGISPDNLTKIFEPFFTTSRNQGGTGLGLHIVYNLVRQTLKGTIYCQSELGLGTTFILTIPIEHLPMIN